MKVSVPRDATKERPTPFAERPRVKREASLDVVERALSRARVGIGGDELGEPGGGRVVDQRRSQRVENLHFRGFAQNLRVERSAHRPLRRVDVRGVRPRIALEHFVQVALGAYQQTVRVTQRVHAGVVARLERVVGVPRVDAVPRVFFRELGTLRLAIIIFIRRVEPRLVDVVAAPDQSHERGPAEILLQVESFVQRFVTRNTAAGCFSRRVRDVARRRLEKKRRRRSLARRGDEREPIVPPQIRRLQIERLGAFHLGRTFPGLGRAFRVVAAPHDSLQTREPALETRHGVVHKQVQTLVLENRISSVGRRERVFDQDANVPRGVRERAEPLRERKHKLGLDVPVVVAHGYEQELVAGGPGREAEPAPAFKVHLHALPPRAVAQRRDTSEPHRRFEGGRESRVSYAVVS